MRKLPPLDAMIFLDKSVKPAYNSLKHAFSKFEEDIMSN